MKYQIDELEALVHPRNGHPKIFAMIDAYLDESGIHDQAKICVIAGYFGGKGQMRKLESAWKSILKDFDFPMQNFHAKDLIKAIRHRPMLETLAKTIGQQRKIYPVSYGIVVKDFDSFSVDQRRFLTGATLNPQSKKLTTSGCPNKPYFVPFQNVVKLITSYAPVGGKAHFNFGIDRPFAEYALVLFKQIEEHAHDPSLPWSMWKSRDRLGTPLFPEAKNTAQLQAADLLVHLTYLHMDKWNSRGEIVSPSGLLRECLSNQRFDTDHQYQDRDNLEKVLIQSRTWVPGWDLATLGT